MQNVKTVEKILIYSSVNFVQKNVKKNISNTTHKHLKMIFFDELLKILIKKKRGLFLNG